MLCTKVSQWVSQSFGLGAQRPKLELASPRQHLEVELLVLVVRLAQLLLFALKLVEASGNLPEVGHLPVLIDDGSRVKNKAHLDERFRRRAGSKRAVARRWCADRAARNGLDVAACRADSSRWGRTTGP